MTAQSRPARIERRTCKEKTRIAGREPNARSEKDSTHDDKGPSRPICQYAGAAVYPVGSPKRLSQRSAARLAGSGESGHLQGNGGVVA